MNEAEAILKYNKLLEEFEQYKKESVKWSIEDFTEYDYPTYTINKEQAQEALERMIHKHDASLGINWDTIEYYITEYGTLKSEIMEEKIIECAHCFGANQLINSKNEAVDCHVCKGGTLKDDDLTQANTIYLETLSKTTKEIVSDLPEEYDNGEY
jgi:Cys-tRNA synthase (O-phospho-L-seryl-tRNA:Cys-tRNA synthase)